MVYSSAFFVYKSEGLNTSRGHLLQMIFTIGYEGLGINRFLEILKDNGIRTLLDCRYNASSMNPDFSKKRLVSFLRAEGIGYEHLKEYGIPREIRNTESAIDWYVKYIRPTIHASVLDRFEQPVCFMCMERDSENCHRRIILDVLRAQGLDGRELYPKKE